jgi:hypothetical protein
MLAVLVAALLPFFWFNEWDETQEMSSMDTDDEASDHSQEGSDSQDFNKT